MKRLGYTVPGPEVPADDTNPRGFAESQWVVDFHTRLLRARRRPGRRRAPVGVGARPRASGLDADGRGRAARLARGQFSLAGHLIVKDPRISWFAPLWRRCAGELGADAAVRDDAAPPGRGDRVQAALVRRPPGRDLARGRLAQPDAVHRARHARVAAGVRPLRRPARRLDARGQPRRRDARPASWCATASPQTMRTVHEFVDQGLRRSRGDWDRLALPDRCAPRPTRRGSSSRGSADEARRRGLRARSTTLRGAYIDLYAEAEAIAHSSIAAARATRRPPTGSSPVAATWLIRRVPAHYKRRVPPRVRARCATGDRVASGRHEGGRPAALRVARRARAARRRAAGRRRTTRCWCACARPPSTRTSGTSSPAGRTCCG